jgi:hypothetical protein
MTTANVKGPAGPGGRPTSAREPNDGPRIARERKTVRAMIVLWCRALHGTTRKSGLCPGCESLAAYADARLERCSFGEEKPVCRECPVHCYRPVEKERMQEVMRWAGPRMLRTHPVLAIRHLLDERKPAPAHPRPRPRESGRS